MITYDPNEPMFHAVEVTNDLISNPVFEVGTIDSPKNIKILLNGSEEIEGYSYDQNTFIVSFVAVDPLPFELGDVLYCVRDELLTQDFNTSDPGLLAQLDSIARQVQMLKGEINQSIKTTLGENPEEFNFNILNASTPGRILAFDADNNQYALSLDQYLNNLSVIGDLSVSMTAAESDINLLQSAISSLDSRLDEAEIAINGKREHFNGTPEIQENKNVPNGYAGLNGDGEITKEQAALALKNGVIYFADISALNLNDPLLPDSFIAMSHSSGNAVYYAVVDGKLNPFFESTKINKTTLAPAGGPVDQFFPRNGYAMVDDVIYDLEDDSIIKDLGPHIEGIAGRVPYEIGDYIIFKSKIDSIWYDINDTMLFAGVADLDLILMNGGAPQMKLGAENFIRSYATITSTTFTNKTLTSLYAHPYESDFQLLSQYGFWGVEEDGHYFYQSVNSFFLQNGVQIPVGSGTLIKTSFFPGGNNGNCIRLCDDGGAYHFEDETGTEITLPVSASSAYLAGINCKYLGVNPVSLEPEWAISHISSVEVPELIRSLEFYIVSSVDWSVKYSEIREMATPIGGELSEIDGSVVVSVDYSYAQVVTTNSIDFARIANVPDYALSEDVDPRLDALEVETHSHTNKTLLDAILAGNLLDSGDRERLWDLADVADELELSLADQAAFNSTALAPPGGVNNVSTALRLLLEWASGIPIAGLELSDIAVVTPLKEIFEAFGYVTPINNAVDLMGSTALMLAAHKTSIDTNTSGVSTNSDDIVLLDARITQNANDIIGLEVGVLESRIAQNELDILDNASDISTNAGNVSANTGGLSVHETRIDDIDTSLAGLATEVDTHENWKTLNPVIPVGKNIFLTSATEVHPELINKTLTKTGDGVTTYDLLPFNEALIVNYSNTSNILFLYDSSFEDMTNKDQELIILGGDGNGVVTCALGFSGSYRYYRLTFKKSAKFIFTDSLTPDGFFLGEEKEIGETYLQLPGEKSPSELAFHGTWATITHLQGLPINGEYLRFAGGYATAFESGVQSGGVQSHRHSGATGSQSANHTHVTNIDHRHGISSGAQLTGGGRAEETGSDTGTIYSDSAGGNKTSGNQSAGHTHSFNTNYTGNTENTVINRTMQMWKRIS